MSHALRKLSYEKWAMNNECVGYELMIFVVEMQFYMFSTLKRFHFTLEIRNSFSYFSFIVIRNNGKSDFLAVIQNTNEFLVLSN